MTDPTRLTPLEAFKVPFRVEPGEPPEPDTVLDSSNKPVPLEWLCAQINGFKTLKRFTRAVPVANSPHYGTDYVRVDDQRVRNEAVPFNRREPANRPTPSMDGRAEFEKWCAQEGYNTSWAHLVTEDSHWYTLETTRRCWYAWQAGAAWQARTPPAAPFGTCEKHGLAKERKDGERGKWTAVCVLCETDHDAMIRDALGIIR